MTDFCHFFFWRGGGQVGGRASDWGRANAPSPSPLMPPLITSLWLPKKYLKISIVELIFNLYNDCLCGFGWQGMNFLGEWWEHGRSYLFLSWERSLSGTIMTNIIIHYQPSYFRYDPHKRVWRTQNLAQTCSLHLFFELGKRPIIVKFSGLQLQIWLENPFRYQTGWLLHVLCQSYDDSSTNGSISWCYHSTSKWAKMQQI